MASLGPRPLFGLLVSGLLASAGCLGIGTDTAETGGDDGADDPTDEGTTTTSAPPAAPPPPEPEPVVRTSTPDTSPPPPVAAAPPVLRQYGCETQYATFGVDETWARERAPEDFGLLAYGDGMAGMAMMMVKTWTCARSTIGVSEVASPGTAAYYLGVDPPEYARAAGGAAYWLPLGFTSSTAEEGALFLAWNMLGAEVGTTAFEVTDLPVGRVVRVEADSSGWTIDFSVAASQGSEANGYLARYFGVVGGRAVNAVDIQVEANTFFSTGRATATLEVPDAPFAGPLVGSGQLQSWTAETLSYTWTYVPLSPS